MHRHIGQVQDKARIQPEFEFHTFHPLSGLPLSVYVEIYGHHKLHISLLLN